MFIKLTNYYLQNGMGMNVRLAPVYEETYIKADLIESIKRCESHSAVRVKNDEGKKVYLVKESPEEIIKMIEEMKK